MEHRRIYRGNMKMKRMRKEKERRNYKIIG